MPLSPTCLAGVTVGVPVTTQGTAAGEPLAVGRLARANATGAEPMPMDCGEAASGATGTTGAGDGIGRLVAGLVELDADAVDQGAVDLLLVPVDADGSLDAAADAALAAAVTGAFGAARDNAARICPGGCVLFVLTSEDPAHAAVGSLAKTLALEWAPSLRVNAIVCPDPADAVGLVALIASPASRALTGAVLDLG